MRYFANTTNHQTHCCPFSSGSRPYECVFPCDKTLQTSVSTLVTVSPVLSSLQSPVSLKWVGPVWAACLFACSVKVLPLSHQQHKQYTERQLIIRHQTSLLSPSLPLWAAGRGGEGGQYSSSRNNTHLSLSELRPAARSCSSSSQCTDTENNYTECMFVNPSFLSWIRHFWKTDERITKSLDGS